jgi:hypothetical protein
LGHKPDSNQDGQVLQGRLTVRWWLQTNPPYLMSVDNASTTGMDFSELLAAQPDIWMVQWTDGRGEIERLELDADNNASNLNGLREDFIDILPYCKFFQQFLTLLIPKALTLPQAKKVQNELIGEVFNSKRQLPFHYPVAAGNYSWDATDATLFSSLVPAVQNTIASLNQLIAEVNRIVAAFNSVDQTVIQQGNNLAGAINGNIVNGANNAFGQINNIFNEVTANCVNPGDALVAFINAYVIATFNSDLLTGMIPAGEQSFSAARPGIPQAGVISCSVDFVPISNNPYATTYVSNPSFGAGPVSWGNLPPVAVSNTVWIPVGSTVPVNVTPAEAAAIMQGIAARTNDLNIKKNTKVGQVNALTTIPAVIAYDVTAGW